jgi:hypothetical protein
MSNTSMSANCLKRFHDGLAGERADVAESEHGGAVRHDGHEIAARGVLVRVLGIGLDRKTGLGDAGGVGEREIALVVQGLRGDDRDLPGTAGTMVIEGVLFFHGG